MYYNQNIEIIALFDKGNDTIFQLFEEAKRHYRA